jgi:glycosyltransferase involved in cell wall biosynthesis
VISVIVTVGPNPVYKNYLDECLESILMQDLGPIEIVLVDDAAHLSEARYDSTLFTYIKPAWHIGQAASINIGIASAQYDWVFVWAAVTTLS